MTTYLNGEAMLYYNECLTRQHEDFLILPVLIEIQHLPNQIQKYCPLWPTKKLKNNKSNHFDKIVFILRPSENLGTSDNYGFWIPLLIGYLISKRKMVKIDWLVWYRLVYWCHFDKRNQTNKQTKKQTKNCGNALQ